MMAMTGRSTRIASAPHCALSADAPLPGGWLVCGVALSVMLLSACAANTPAPVVSLEQVSQPPAAQARRAPTTPALKKPARYEVNKGDTLYSMAWRYGLDYKRLARWNRIAAPYPIYVGQVLSLKPPAMVAESKPKPRSKPPMPPPVVQKKPVPPPAPKPPLPTPKPPPAPAPEKTLLEAPKVAPRADAKAAPEKRVDVTLAATPESRPPPVRQKPPLPPRKSGSLTWIWPTRGDVIQTFRKDDRTRQGIRISGKLGQDVLAAETGKVVYTGSGLPGYGKLIIIKHNKNYLSAYGFNRKLLVRDGEQVARGERVAEMGSSADGKALLHFEIRRRDTPLNPLGLLPR